MSSNKQDFEPKSLSLGDSLYRESKIRAILWIVVPLAIAIGFFATLWPS